MQSVALKLDRVFGFTERGSSLRQELIAGLTTFSTMSYVLIVNPQILAAGGMDRTALITATAVAVAFFSILMGLRTNYPLAMGPGLGASAYVAVQVCQGMHIPWQAALGLVFYTGVLFLIIALTGIRKRIIDAFPYFFKKIVSAGLGLFIAFLGIKHAGIVVANSRSLIALGDFTAVPVLLGFCGILLTCVLVSRKVPGALILSIAAMTLAGLFLHTVPGGPSITPASTHIFSLPRSMAPVAFKLDLMYFWRHPFQSLPIVIALLFTDLFSAMAVLFAIGSRAGLNDAEGNLPKLAEALTTDALAASGGAMLGNTTTIIYLESAAGVEQGGRTGLVSIVVALAFVLSLFVTPLIAAVPTIATSGALVAIGIFMMQGLADIDLRDIRIASVTLVTLLLMALTSASDGLALGFILNVLLTIANRETRSIKPLAWILVALFVLHYLFKT